MKKTFMLASLIAMTAMASGTTGTVKTTLETEGNFITETKAVEKNKELSTSTSKTYKLGKAIVETEVKVNGTGLSFGGTFKAEDITLNGKNNKKNSLNKSSAFIKYELPEFKGVNSYIKATINPKFVQEFKANKSVDKGNAQLEADVNYAIMKDVKLGLNTKTTLPFSNQKFGAKADAKKITDGAYATKVSSTHKLYLDAKEISVLKDVKAEVEVNHVYKESKKDAKDAFKNVQGKVEATYDKVKDVKLEGKVSFKRSVNGELKAEYKVLEQKLFAEAPIRYIHSYELKGTYTGIEHLTLTAKPFIAHVNEYKKSNEDRKDVIIYGAELGAEYKMLNDKLTLTGKSLLSGRTNDVKFVSKDNSKSKIQLTQGIFAFDVNAKYDHKVTDKFTVSPEANANLSLIAYKQGKKSIVIPNLTLTPKLTAEYKPAESLTIKGSLGLPINFGRIDEFNKVNGYYTKVGKKFGYKSTSIKTSLNVEYKW